MYGLQNFTDNTYYNCVFFFFFKIEIDKILLHIDYVTKDKIDYSYYQLKKRF